MRRLKTLSTVVGISLVLALFTNMGRPQLSTKSSLTVAEISAEHQRIHSRWAKNYYGKGSRIVEEELRMMAAYAVTKTDKIKDCFQLENAIPTLLPNFYIFGSLAHPKREYCMTRRLIGTISPRL